MPEVGLSDKRCRALFGFLFMRFEPHVYYWELLEVTRKFILVLVKVWVYDPLVQSIVAAFGVMLLLLLLINVKPFVKYAYDLHDIFCATVEVTAHTTR